MVNQKPKPTRLYRCVVGAAFGWVISFTVVLATESEIRDSSKWLVDVLVRLGLAASGSIAPPYLYLMFGVIFAGMAIGGGIGWWLARGKGSQ